MTNRDAGPADGASDFDVAVIGGGPAGLAGALALARSAKRVVLYDCWPPRNAVASEIRGFVTQDGTPPAEMRSIARKELAHYDDVTVRDDEPVETITGERGAFTVVSRDGAERVRVRRVLLCVGLIDRLPDLPGYRELWGSAVFQCPYCHAWEVRDRAFGYLAPDEHCMDWAVLLRSWTQDLIVFTDGRFVPSPAVATDMARARIRIEPGRVVAFRGDAGQLVGVELASGEVIPRDVMFVRPPQVQTPLVRELALRLDGRDLVHTDEHGETSIPGIYAAGDLALHDHGALTAAASGSRVARALDEGLTRELVLV